MVLTHMNNLTTKNLSMKIFLTITLSFLFNHLFSQEIKTYKGEYEHGQATYEYYENSDYERIFNGKFIYSSRQGNPSQNTLTRFLEETNITGSYKENKRVGSWEAKETFISAGTERTTIWKGNYENGLKTGLWSFSMHVVADKKPTDFKAVFNFDKDILVGKVNIGDLKGSLSNEGIFTGLWNIKSNQGIEYIAEFKNNIFTKLVVRKVSDGEIFMKYICDSANIYNESEYELVNCKDIKSSDETHVNDISNKYFIEFFNQIESIQSLDKPLNKIELGSSTFTITQPKIAIKKKLTYEDRKKKIAYDKAIQLGDEYFSSKDYANAILQYNKAINLEDNQYSKEQIKKCESLLVQVINEKYNSHIDLGNKYYKSSNYSLAISEFQNALKIKETEEYPKQQIIVINSKIKELEEIEQQKKELEKEKRRLEMLKKEITKLESDIKLNHNKLLGNTSLTKKKKALNNSYLILYKKSNEIVDENEKLTHLKNLKLLQENINYLINLSSNSVEKQLKSVDNTDEIWKIIKANLKVSWY